MHCHRRHHPMNAMGHDIPNMLGVNQEGVETQIQKQLPGYMAMGEKGMHEMVMHSKHMEGPTNTLPMMGGEGPFGSVGMGGMFTILKVRDNIKTYEDPAWYENPEGTVADSAGWDKVPLSTPSAQDHGAMKHEMHEHGGEKMQANQ